jgi:hypothetical protein
LSCDGFDSVQESIKLRHPCRHCFLTFLLRSRGAPKSLLDLTENECRASGDLLPKFVDAPPKSLLDICAESPGVQMHKFSGLASNALQRYRSQ